MKKLALVVLAAFACLFLSYRQGFFSNDLSGQIIKSGQWNNYGYQVKIYQGKNLIDQTTTSLNGFFHVKNLLPGEYTVLVFEDDLFLAKQQINFPSQHFILKVEGKNLGLGFFDFVLLIINLSLLVVAVWFLVHAHNSKLARYYLLLFSVPFIYSSCEYLQNVLALNHWEILAADFSALKLSGLIYFGYVLDLFSKQILSDQPRSQLIRKIVFTLFIVEAVILSSFFFLNNDYLFSSFWKFSFPLFRNVLIVQNIVWFVLVLTDIYNKKSEAGQYLSREVVNRLQFMFFALLFTIIFLCLMVFGPVILFEKEIFSFSFAISFASLILFASFFYALRGYRLPYVGFIVSRSIVLTIFSFLFVVIYSALMIVLKNGIDQMNLNYLDSYLIFLLFLIFIPFLNIIVKLMNQQIFKSSYNAVTALKKLGKEVLSSINSDEISLLTCSVLKDIMNAGKIEIFLKNKKQFISPLDKKVFNPNTNLDSSLTYPIKTRQEIRGYLVISSLTIFPDKILEDCLFNFLDDLAISLSNATLHEQITKMNQKILQTEKLLAQENKMSTVGLISARLAHEIKNPLGILQNMTAMLEKKNMDTEFIGKFMEIVPRQLNRIDEMIKVLLNYSRPREMKFVTVDLWQIMSTVLNLIKPVILKKSINLKLTGKSLPMRADADALEQVFINLLLNATEAVYNLGKITVTLNYCKDKNVVKIKDNGKGINKNDLKKIFEPFFTKKNTGNGLGLATVQNIINAHQGRISVKSKVGTGTEFIIELPLENS